MGDIHFHGSERRPEGPPPRQLPAGTRIFVNRTHELNRLNALLAQESADEPLILSVCVIAGTAGAGKTSLALRWAHQVKDRFPDGQLYINLRGYDPREPVTPEEALHHFLTGLGVPAAAIPAEPESAAALYRSLLADRGVLIVLDNAVAVSQVRPLLPGNSRCLVVVTSRGRLSGLAVRDSAERITLGTLPEPEAVALLRTVTAGYRPEEDTGKLRELARLCARLPLALRIAAERAATHPHMGLDELIADLRDESALWDALSTGDEDSDGDGTDAVRSVFAWSYRALSPDEARVFRLLGLHPGPGFGLDAASALAGIAGRRTRQLLDVLVGAHLLEQTAPDRYEFHDLLRAYATDQVRLEDAPDERSAAVRRVLDWYLRSARAARDFISPPASPPASAPAGPPANPVPGLSGEGQEGEGRPPEGVVPAVFTDYDQAVNWSEREHINFTPAVRLAEEAGLDGYACRLADVLYGTQAPSAPVQDWISAGEIGLAAARRTGDRATESTLLHYLGFAHRRVGRLAEAADLHERSLLIRRELEDRRGEAETLSALGLVHLRRRQLDRAEDRFDQAIGIFRALGATQRAYTALSNRAATRFAAGLLAEAADDLRRAIPAHREAGRKAALGDALRLSSAVHLELGQAQEALKLADEAVELALELRDHTLEGYWLLTAGNAHRALGHYSAALASYHRSAVLHRRLGDTDREALAWQGTAGTYWLMDRSQEAVDFQRMAVTSFSRSADVWNRALALAGLADLLHPGDPAAATGHRRDALGLISAYADPRAVHLRRELERRLTAPPA
ncbi:MULTISPECIES: ATP-binding protein [unclassified Streptomyces]|uniref:ATP-binding protein n=1 Tax=unclassified Streptomyces TaxID=2593676 RepID=UPI002E27D805|nr:tetratricopeptide repeat protein [Streptomyces sp. NBC_00223]